MRYFKPYLGNYFTFFNSVTAVEVIFKKKYSSVLLAAELNQSAREVGQRVVRIIRDG